VDKPQKRKRQENHARHHHQDHPAVSRRQNAIT
jgi:hypothetical protein